MTVSHLQLQIKTFQNMLIKEVKVFHSRKSFNDSVPQNLLDNLFQPKCLILPDKAFQTKC